MTVRFGPVDHSWLCVPARGRPSAVRSPSFDPCQLLAIASMTRVTARPATASRCASLSTTVGRGSVGTVDLSMRFAEFPLWITHGLPRKPHDTSRSSMPRSELRRCGPAWQRTKYSIELPGIAQRLSDASEQYAVSNP